MNEWDSIIASHKHQKSSSVMADSSEFFEKFCFVRSPLLDNYYEKTRMAERQLNEMVWFIYWKKILIIKSW